MGIRTRNLTNLLNKRYLTISILATYLINLFVFLPDGRQPECKIHRATNQLTQLLILASSWRTVHSTAKIQSINIS